MTNELSADQLSELKQALLELTAELEQLLAATREGTRPVDLDQPIGRLTRMDAIQQQKMATANRHAFDLRLRQVRQALHTIPGGTYGLCRRCEDPIGYARLEARPESPYCLDCQDEVDRKHA